ncbi:MAG: hypothetical protein Q8K89_01775 [Actinomycetota bacterium]|nr:hypothetical protein [Actinomycetota bacterium]
MSWRQGDEPALLVRAAEKDEARDTRLSVNAACFMRRQHKCGKVFGASKSCFVACPTEDELEPLLALVAAKLSGHGIEAVIAVKERAYGQEIVCTKICGRIIESRFCIAILDDSLRDGHKVPNPNVYYEYGLMTALRKHVIPLQREDLDLAFNIRSQDTIKYGPGNMAEELERAIRDAIAQTQPGEADASSDDGVRLTARTIRSRLELAGYRLADRTDAVSEVTAETLFAGFFGRKMKPSYLLLAKLDSAGEAQMYADDLAVVLYRMRTLRSETQDELDSIPDRLIKVHRGRSGASVSRLSDLDDEEARLEERRRILFRRRAWLEHVAIGYVASDDLDGTVLRKITADALSGSTWLSSALGAAGVLVIDDHEIPLGPGILSDASSSDVGIEDLDLRL